MSTTSTITTVPTATTGTGTRNARPACTRLPQVFQHPLLEEPPTSSARIAQRREHATLLAAAGEACRSCPLAASCLYEAVVEHDVAGFVGGTTARQRLEVRRLLGVRVSAEDFDTLAGVVGGRQVDHEEVLRLRAAHPDESLEVLARRLGCSLSTVKRHLRQERNTPSAAPAPAPKPRLRQVLAATAQVVDAGRASSRAA